MLIHQLDELVVRNHIHYRAAKDGNLVAAALLVAELGDENIAQSLSGRLQEHKPVLLPVYAEESEGYNRIPMALANWLGARTGWDVSDEVVQANKVSRTRKDGYYRLAIQPLFAGPVAPGQAYVLVDDFIGQGATFANLRGHVVAGGGRVVGSTSLTGKAISATLGLVPGTLEGLRNIHGQDLENWWYETFGYRFDALTESEARYLKQYSDAKRIRAEVVARFGTVGE